MRNIQSEHTSDPLEVIKYAHTRWLSLKEALERVLDLLPDLSKFYKEYGTNIEKRYFTKENEAYLKVLSLLVGKINGYNEYFQKDHIYYDSLADKIRESYVIFLNSILKKEERNLDFKTLIDLPVETKKTMKLKAARMIQNS